MKSAEIVDFLLMDIQAYKDSLVGMVVVILERDYACAGLDPDANQASIEGLAHYIFKCKGRLFGGIDLRAALVDFIDSSPYHRIYWNAYFSGVEGGALDKVDSLAWEIDDIIKAAETK